MRLFSLLPILTALLLFSVPMQPASAQPVPQIIPSSTLTGCSFADGRHKPECIPSFIGHIIVTVFQLLSGLFLINVLYAGYQIAMGSWTGEKAAGKDRLLWSIIGLIVSVCSYLILELVLSIVWEGGGP